MEMHIIAYVYHWGRDSLWYMPVRERRKWVDLIKRQKEAERESLENND